jgi:hypothetical protein
MISAEPKGFPFETEVSGGLSTLAIPNMVLQDSPDGKPKLRPVKILSLTHVDNCSKKSGMEGARQRDGL